MNRFSKRAARYLLFEQPLTNTWVDQAFISIHTTQLEQNEAWTTKATRLKMIFLFWSKCYKPLGSCLSYFHSYHTTSLS